MAYKVKILPSAAAELDEIVTYLQSFSDNAALNFIDHYEKQLRLLQSGKLTYALSRMPELAELGYRVALLDKYLFLYYIEDKNLVIAHFFHQRQDYAKLAFKRE